jgi:hypothetical protein
MVYKNAAMNFIALQTSTMMLSQCCTGQEASRTMKKECSMGPIKNDILMKYLLKSISISVTYSSLKLKSFF